MINLGLSCSHSSTSALDGLDFLGRPDGAAEAGGQLVTIEEHALGWLDGGQGSGSSASDAGLGETGDGVSQRAVLLGSLAVLAERDVGSAAREVGWKRVGGRSGVRLRGVVNRGWTSEQIKKLAFDALVENRSVGTLVVAAKWVEGKRRRRREGRTHDVPGMERFPMNLIEGTRSAWAAACRSARVANILSFVYVRRSFWRRGRLGVVA